MNHDKMPARDGARPDRDGWQDRDGDSILKSALHVHGTTFDGRLLGFSFDGESAVLMDFSGREVVLATMCSEHHEKAFGILVTAPGTEEDLASAIALIPDRTPLVVVEGGTEITRALLSQAARLSKGLTSVIVDDGSTDFAEYLITSGQADAVARTQTGEQDAAQLTENRGKSK